MSEKPLITVSYETAEGVRVELSGFHFDSLISLTEKILEL